VEQKDLKLEKMSRKTTEGEGLNAGGKTPEELKEDDLGFLSELLNINNLQ
jgi:hypothetical protein